MAEQFPEQSGTGRTTPEQAFKDIDRYVSQGGSWPFTEPASPDQILMVSQLRALRQITRDLRSVQIGVVVLTLLLLLRACGVI